MALRSILAGVAAAGLLAGGSIAVAQTRSAPDADGFRLDVTPADAERSDTAQRDEGLKARADEADAPRDEPDAGAELRAERESAVNADARVQPLPFSPASTFWVLEGTTLAAVLVGLTGVALLIRRRRLDDMAAAALERSAAPPTPEELLRRIERLFEEQRVEIGRLSERLRVLETRTPDARTPTGDRDDDRLTWGSSTHTTAVVQPSAEALRRQAKRELDEMLIAYAALIANKERSAFKQGRTIEGVRAEGHGASILKAVEAADNAPLWAVQVGDRWIGLPGWATIKGWDWNYRVASGGTAKEQFGGVYDMQSGESSLRIIEPAVLEPIGDGFRVAERGLLAGIP